MPLDAVGAPFAGRAAQKKAAYPAFGFRRAKSTRREEHRKVVDPTTTQLKELL
jgi:hypothetical protein